jgi:dipeptidyl aminopeptidase/acylaminoacyl peptidase
MNDADQQRPSPTTPTIAPYGSWVSALGAEAIARAGLRLGQVALDGDAVLWTEGRAADGGRNVLVRAEPGSAPRDATPAPWNVRSRVHEYGGGAFALDGADVFFVHFDDQRVYRLDASGAATAVTHGPDRRYADLRPDRRRGRLIAVREDHAAEAPRDSTRQAAREPVNALVAIDLDSGAETVLAGGHDFHASPALSPGGDRLAWLTWDHPDMPWDGCELWVAAIEADGTLATARRVEGGRGVSIFQPTWSPAGELHFVSDRSGWWNLYRERNGTVEPLCPMSAEFGEAQWQFGLSTYGFDGDGAIVCTYRHQGVSHLARLDPEGGALHEIETPYRAIRELKVGAGCAAIVGGSPTQAEAVVRRELASGAPRVLRATRDPAPHPAQVSVAEPITYPSADGRIAHAFFYAPKNRDHAGPPGEKPPLIVIDHGGPTGSTDPTLRQSVQFWTQRGFALVDVNYGGSTGYGRAYRDSLKGRWGVVDVEDSIAAARFLAERGDVDPARVAIRGSSAGGYTTLAALAFHDFFAAGASHYGIGDLETLARDTHKFEARYLDSLVGPWPEAAALYRERSPIHHTERISSALILFQGADDQVVPPAQSQAMFEAVRARGLPVAYLLFEGESHGFRRAETIRRALEAELWFYGRVLGFEPADAIEPVTLENAPPEPAPPR